MGGRILAFIASASALRPGSKPRSALVPRSTLHRAAALRRSATTLRSTLSRDDATVEDMLTQQLGYSPPNLVEVAAWTAAGTPAVIRALELISGLPLPHRTAGPYLAWCLLGALGLTVLAGAYPIWRMNRLDAVRAVRTG